VGLRRGDLNRLTRRRGTASRCLRGHLLRRSSLTVKSPTTACPTKDTPVVAARLIPALFHRLPAIPPQPSHSPSQTTRSDQAGRTTKADQLRTTMLLLMTSWDSIQHRVPPLRLVSQLLEPRLPCSCKLQRRLRPTSTRFLVSITRHSPANALVEAHREQAPSPAVILELTLSGTSRHLRRLSHGHPAPPRGKVL
jgi:hypothetical protein